MGTPEGTGPDSTRPVPVALLGLGRMGAPMAANLVAAGHDVVVWNRTAARAEAFAAEHGARAAATPAEAVRGREVVITMLADDDALWGVYDGPDGAAAALEPGATAVDMSTVAPTTIARVAELLARRGNALVDAPVSGSTPAATAATLTIMAAGDEAAVEAVRPVLAALGDPVLHLGPSGSGSAMKLAVNTVVHGLNQALSEALVLAERAGIDRATAYRVFTESAIAAPYVGYKRAAFVEPGSVPVGFAASLAAKDLRLAAALADEVGARLPQARTTLAVLDEVGAAGLGDRDESVVAEHLRSTSPTPAP
jgi:3-hydroxyisobutyrate dehydrogenase-like beta-hydroxyacid dehydrogenase